MEATPVGLISQAVAGRLLSGNPEALATGVSTDSRKVKAGDLFFALRGRRFDGHDFVGEALTRGAVGAVVSRLPANLPDLGDRCLILVEDTLRALQEWARYYRSRFKLVVVGITGSTGKTTTKDLTARVLGCRWPTLASPESFNNEIGLPLTLLQLRSHHQALVVEMGMRGRGQIAFLCSLARPNCGVITNIGPAHLELLGSLENIAAAKGELLESLPSDGLAVLNFDDPYCRRLGESAQCLVRYFGFGEGADVRADGLYPTAHGYQFNAWFEGKAVPVSLPLWGRHNVLNALAAMTLGFYLGIEPALLAEALREARHGGMRLEAVPGIRGTLLINDAYNANPVSVKAALEVLAERRARRAVAVLGDMLELGEFSRRAHYEVGQAAARLGIDTLVAIGRHAADVAGGALEAGMAQEKVRCCATKEEAEALLRQILQEGDLVLVKASRAMGLETLVEALRVEA
jgi:UDP-N-acetylmuramoyl-tripeptide--D-alanyl-D-alanine ligase